MLTCIATIEDFTVGDIYYRRLQSCPVEAVNLFGVRREEAGLSGRCVIDGIKCLVSAKEGGDSGSSFLKGSDDSVWLWTFMSQITISTSRPRKNQIGATIYGCAEVTPLGPSSACARR